MQTLVKVSAEHLFHVSNIVISFIMNGLEPSMRQATFVESPDGGSALSLTIAYALFAIAFGIVLFTSPVKSE